MALHLLLNCCHLLYSSSGKRDQSNGDHRLGSPPAEDDVMALLERGALAGDSQRKAPRNREEIVVNAMDIETHPRQISIN